MRPDGGHATGHLFAALRRQLLGKALPELFQRKGRTIRLGTEFEYILAFGLRQRVVGRLVKQAQHFIIVGQLLVDRLSNRFQLTDGGNAGVHQDRAALAEELVPIIELAGVTAALIELLQQRIALRNHLVIFAQRLGVTRHDL